MKFRKKPVVIEAISFDEFIEYGKNNGGNIVNGMPWSFKYNGYPVTHENDECYLIPTLEGALHFTPKDMLITGVKGEIYPCKLDIFEATYNPSETTGLSFGQALEAMNEGSKVSRSGWNGKGMWIAKSGTGDGEGGGRVNEAKDFWNPHAKAFAEANGGTAEVLPLVIMKTADGKILMGWLASQSDMFATDWGVVE